MTAARPELLYVSGPRKGQRAVLMNNVVLVGRGADVDIRLDESSVSRRHMEFSLTQEGWIVECLAKGNLIFINDKNTKPASAS